MLSKLSFVKFVVVCLLLVAVESLPSIRDSQFDAFFANSAGRWRPGRPLKRSLNEEKYAIDTSSSESDAGPPTAAIDDNRPQSVDVLVHHDLDVGARPSRWHFGPGGIWTRFSLVDEDVLNALQQADVPQPSGKLRH